MLTLFQNRKIFHVAPSKLPRSLPSVSILIPAYNEAHCIAQTIDSCLKVDYPLGLLDIIVVNDGSKDNTGEIAKKYAKEGKITYFENNPNKGKSTSLNIGFEKARTEYIVTIDADTIVEPDII
jgi:glycosyltransferase involved in cell wall biosynthesis